MFREKRLAARSFWTVAACSFGLAAASLPTLAGDVPGTLTDSDLRLLVPDGFRSAMVLSHDFSGKGYPQYIVALADSNSEAPQRPIDLLYLDWDGKWVVRDRRPIRSQDSGEWAQSWAPNYLEAMRLETIGQKPLLFVYTECWWGGTGSVHWFSFYAVHDGKLSLIKQFEHGRMMRSYFCLKNNVIYDAVLVKSRGPKHGNAYVYTCYLDVSKYTCDGTAIVKVGSEKLREKTGNRFLDEQYWNMSVCNALARGEAFQSDFAPRR